MYFARCRKIKVKFILLGIVIELSTEHCTFLIMSFLKATRDHNIIYNNISIKLIRLYSIQLLNDLATRSNDSADDADILMDCPVL